MSPEIIAQLAPTGVLRAGINLSNFLLVTGRSAEGDPQGVSPSMAAAIAARLGVDIRLGEGVEAIAYEGRRAVGVEAGGRRGRWRAQRGA